jgi:hypothetical protein
MTLDAEPLDSKPLPGECRGGTPSGRATRPDGGWAGHPTPVDVYPEGATLGATPEGVDLARNVWEWTRSLWGTDWVPSGPVK